MVIARKPTTYKCLRCGWSNTVGLTSDVFIEGGNIFSICPKCHNPELKTTDASIFEQAITKLKSRLKNNISH